MSISITVSQLSNYISSLLKRESFLSNITVEGEVSNLARSGGNIFFNLKDEKASLRCIVFRNYSLNLTDKISDGQLIKATGSIATYALGSSYQLIVRDVETGGDGKLYLNFLKLKEKLQKEGIFEPSLKKTIPQIPSKIGLITSINGAALRDILNVIKRRYPICELYLYPASVQGVNAVPEIIEALNFFDNNNLVEFVIISRGGGSFEDLNEFNNEDLIRFIHKSKIPVVSAIGHHVDSTLTDFVSDIVAATPTESAELVAPDIQNLRGELDFLNQRLIKAIVSRISNEYNQYEYIEKELKFNSPLLKLENKKTELYIRLKDLTNLITRNIFIKKNNLETLYNKLKYYDNKQILDKGYSLTLFDEEIIDSIDKIKIGNKVDIYLKDGSFTAEVISKESK